jgi:hypothetical protein
LPYVTARLLRRTAAVLLLASIGAVPAFGASEHLGQRVLREGMRGHDVRVLQQFLGFAGFPTAIDGDFGPQTQSHVRAFEHRYHMAANGVAGAPVVRLLRTIVANREGTQVVASASGGAAFGQPPTPPSGSDGGGGSGGGGSAGTPPAPPEKATLVNGLAVAPADAPQVVKKVIAAANRIATKPYVYGGGHGSFTSYGYDCSGSVSFALHGGGLLNVTMDSTEFETWGSPGAGTWITLWTNAGHVYMEVAGLWFDTAAQSSSNGNDRWSKVRVDSAAGYIERHPTGW